MAIHQDQESEPKDSELIEIDHYKSLGIIDEPAIFKNKTRFFKESITKKYRNKYLIIKFKVIKEKNDEHTEHDLFDTYQLNLTQHLRSHVAK